MSWITSIAKTSGSLLMRAGIGFTFAVAIMFSIAAVAVGCAPTTTERLNLPPLETVDFVDLERYMGTWYEIAHFPQFFQKGCTGSTATYTLRENGKVGVVNRCRKGSLDGPESIARGTATVVDPTTNAKLSVTFFWPFYGDYWVIDLDTEYQYAVVGHPSRDYLWILCRKPQMDEAQYGEILTRLENIGYQTERLVRTLQPGPAQD